MAEREAALAANVTRHADAVAEARVRFLAADVLRMLASWQWAHIFDPW